VQVAMAESPFWITVNMTFWQAAFLPKWVQDIGYSGRVWAAYNASPILTGMGFNWAASASYAGGCSSKSTDWTDPPIGPPYILLK
jgi:hypothetical protein